MIAIQRIFNTNLQNKMVIAAIDPAASMAATNNSVPEEIPAAIGAKRQAVIAQA